MVGTSRACDVAATPSKGDFPKSNFVRGPGYGDFFCDVFGRPDSDFYPPELDSAPCSTIQSEIGEFADFLCALYEVDGKAFFCDDHKITWRDHLRSDALDAVPSADLFPDTRFAT